MKRRLFFLGIPPMWMQWLMLAISIVFLYWIAQ